MKFIITIFFIFQQISSVVYGADFFNWGKIKVDLFRSGENHYTGSAAVVKNDMKNSVRLVMELYLDDKKVDRFAGKHFLYYRAITNTTIELPTDPYIDKINTASFDDKINSIGTDDEFTVLLSVDGGKQVSIRIRVIEDLRGYKPPFGVGIIAKNNRFDYQLVTTYNGQQVLKLDTTITTNKNVLAAYRKVQNVRVSHVPGFFSSTNFLSERDSVIYAGKRSVNSHIVRPATQSYLTHSVESNDFIGSEMSLQWGRLHANPDAPVYSMIYLKNELSAPWNLLLSNKKYQIAAMRFTLYDGNTLNRAYYLYPPFEIPVDDIKKIRDPFSILIDQLVIKNKDGSDVYSPQVFMFNFE